MKIKDLIALQKQKAKPVKSLLSGRGANSDFSKAIAAHALQSQLRLQSEDDDIAALGKALSDAALVDPLKSNTNLSELAMAHLKIKRAPKKLQDRAMGIFRKRTASIDNKEPDTDDIPDLTLADAIDLDQPLAQNPTTAEWIRLGRGAETALALGLSEKLTQKLADAKITLGEPLLKTADELVAEEVLTQAEAKQFGAKQNIARLTESNPVIAKRLAAKFPSHLTKTQDLLHLTEKDWAALAKGEEKNTHLKPADWGKVMVSRIEAAHPELAIGKKLEINARSTVKSAAMLIRLGKKVDRDLIATASLGDDDLESIAANKRQQYIDAHALVRRAIRLHPGLDIEKTLKSEQDAQSKIKEIDALSANTNKFLVQNEGLLGKRIGGLSGKTDKLDFKGIPKKNQPQLMKFAKTYQGLFAVAGTADTVHKLAGHGFKSISQIAAKGVAPLVVSGELSRFEADEITKRARNFAPVITAQIGRLNDVNASFRNDFADDIRDPQRKPNPGMWRDLFHKEPAKAGVLKDLPGYKELFGSQDYCACEHCSSILGPGAYFVDLMNFIDEHVTFVCPPDLSVVLSEGYISSHPLNLKVRRPDLWSLPITCENTNTEIPNLQIVVEVLEAYLASLGERGGTYTSDEEFDYHLYTVWLPNAREGLNQPFNLSHEEIKIFLDHHGIRMRELVDILGVGRDAKDHLYLEISNEQYKEIITSNKGPNAPTSDRRPALAVVFADIVELLFDRELLEKNGLELGTDTFPKFNVNRLYGPTGLSRKEIGLIIETEYLQSAAGNDLRVFIDKRDPEESIQDDIEYISGLTVAALDRMRRFIRLQRVLGWSFAEIDEASTYINRLRGNEPDLSAETISALVEIDRLRHRLDCSIADALAINEGIPHSFHNDFWEEVAPDTERPSQFIFYSEFSNRFNVRPFSAEEEWPADSRTILLPAFADKQPDQEDERKKYDAAIAAAARLRAGLGLTEQEFTNLSVALKDSIRLNVDDPEGAHFGTFNGSAENLSILYRHVLLAQSLEIPFQQLAQTLSLTLGEVRAISTIDDLEELFAFLDYRNATSRSLEEIDALITGVPKQIDDTVTEDIEFPISIETHPDLPNILGFEKEIIEGAFKIANVAEQRIASTAELNSILTLCQLLKPLKLVLEDYTYIAENLFMGFSGPSTFDGKFSFRTLRWIEAYAALISATAIEDRPDFRELLATYDLVTNFERRQLRAGEPDDAEQANKDHKKRLEKFFGSAAKALSQFQTDHFPANAVGNFLKYHEIISLAERLNVSVSDLAAGSDSDFRSFSRLSKALEAGLRGSSSESQTPTKTTDPIDEKLLELKRDALVTHFTDTLRGAFRKPDDIYHYFLIDPQMEGCGRTSRIVSATASLQLYVQRILMNMEETGAGFEKPIKVNANTIPLAEWEWRKNYRVWEANRKVFLYPENYLLPELRDNKTELFDEFEEALTGQDINPDIVRNAYIRYLRGFDELSRMKISGAYHEGEGASGVLHLFGVTTDQPYKHFYRRVVGFETNAPDWGPWREMDLKIPVQKISAIVHQGRLHIFWVEVTTLPQQEMLEGGRQQFTGYHHNFRLYYSIRRLDGTWMEPQRLKLDTFPFLNGDGVIGDARLFSLQDGDRSLQYEYTSEVFWDRYFMPYSERTFETDEIDGGDHSTPKEGYSLTGTPWDRVYPEVSEDTSDTIYLRGFNYTILSSINFRDGRLLNYEREQYQPFLQPEKNSKKYNLPVFLSIDKGGRQFQLNAYRSSKSLLGGLAAIELLSDKQKLKNKILLEEKTLAGPSGTLDITGKSENHQLWGSQVNGLNSRYIPAQLVFPLEYEQTGHQLRALRSELLLSALNDGDSLATFRSKGTPQLIPIGGSEQHSICELDSIKIVFRNPHSSKKYIWEYLVTGVSDPIFRGIYQQDIEKALGTDFQMSLEPKDKGFTISDGGIDASTTERYRQLYEGAEGNYLQEIYFHAPLAIAKALNARGDYAEARKWYHYIFDPFATEGEETNDGTRASPVWRYRYFRELEKESTKSELTDDAALAKYRNDPFNPHAIARLRPSAYQKYVVLSYVDNLLDEADSLFATDQREQINEAVLLYVTALEILGARPKQLGNCDEASKENDLTFEGISNLSSSDDILLEIEAGALQHAEGIEDNNLKGRKLNHAVNLGYSANRPLLENVIDFNTGTNDLTIATEPLSALANARKPKTPVSAPGPFGYEAGIKKTSARNRVSGSYVGAVALNQTAKSRSVHTNVNVNTGAATLTDITIRDGLADIFGQSIGSPAIDYGLSLLKTIKPIFCVPENDALKGYWDRVEDRLFKIRNCMNINGVRRSLSLFSPPIDPLLLIRARQDGLEIGDVLQGLYEPVPNYRFTFQIERAKAAANSASALGNALERALASRNSEELAQLRNTHQANILKETKSQREMEIETTHINLAELEKQETATQARKTHFEAIRGDIPAEVTEKTNRQKSADHRNIAAGLNLQASYVSLITDLGAPFTIEWGGTQLTNALNFAAQFKQMEASRADVSAAQAANSASKSRRGEDWDFQKEQAMAELGVIEQRKAAAELRITMAEKELKLHELQERQSAEIIDFVDEKFSNIDLYTFFSKELQRLYRQSFNIAQKYGAMAEKAFKFEYGGGVSPDSFVEGKNYWDINRKGLLAADKLSLDLARMEQKFIEGNDRRYEITQTFSLMQLNPNALLNFRMTGDLGKAGLTIPKYAFDIFYPGQINRRIKSVQLTIPCIVGPYTNVSAKLSLDRSGRNVPARNMIAASSGQSDSGLFELNFRDERYLPFEGADAEDSTWQLSLPKNVRPFDYSTISDVLITLRYTAEDATVSSPPDSAPLDVFKDTDFKRILSLKQDFSTEFRRLSETDNEVAFDITERYFPMYFLGRDLEDLKTQLVVQLKDGKSKPDFDSLRIRINTEGSEFSVFDSASNDTDTPSLFTQLIEKNAEESALRVISIAADKGALSETIDDMYLVIEFSVKS